MQKIALCLFFFGYFSEAKLPEYITPCPITDSSCLKEHAQATLKALLNDGDRKFKIPRLYPLIIPELELGTGGLTLRIKNLTVEGIEDGILDTVKFDPINKKALVKIVLPYSRMFGNYTAKGHILILTLDSADKGEVIARGGEFTWNFDYILEKRNGDEYAKITNDSISFKIEKAEMYFKNIVNGNERLSNSTNELLNSEWKTVVEDFGPPIAQTIKGVYNLILGSYFQRIPFNQLFVLK
ncbi:unnamed protein product [Brassicogethes aeneus]|uniref:Uncharacterized protein n=1 Tax=Brassicogethes aeneus TaxID=1431903 RepID=A0A9P0B1T4_BRAAE|nr:unnamed protein product [Brassicogethes aeneus]